jgi:hypothetical protein
MKCPKVVTSAACLVRRYSLTMFRYPLRRAVWFEGRVEFNEGGARSDARIGGQATCLFYAGIKAPGHAGQESGGTLFWEEVRGRGEGKRKYWRTFLGRSERKIGRGREKEKEREKEVVIRQ